MGQYVGRLIAKELTLRTAPDTPRAPFAYRDKGSMAVIGKAKAVVEIGSFRCGGLLAWFLWGGVHVAFLINFRNRLQVLLSWFWNWLLNARDARLITGDARLDIHTPRPDEYVETPRSAPAKDSVPRC